MLKATSRLRLDGVLTVSADRAVPVVAAVAEARGLPGIGVATAHLMTHKIAMRRALAEAGVPQPRFAAVRTLSETRRAADEVGFPAVLKPADSGGQRGVFRVESVDDIDRHLHEALASSPAGDAILEEYVEGTELNGIVLARDGEAIPLTLSDRLRPPGVGFGVGWIHVYPPTIPREQLRESRARRRAHRARARPAHGHRVPAADRGATTGASSSSNAPRASRAGRWPTSCASRSASTSSTCSSRWRSARSCRTSSVKPQFTQPLAIRFFTAEPGPLPTGRVVRVGPLDKVLAFPGVVQADTYLTVGEIIRPVRLDGDRRGYVIATADTNLEALARAEAAARLLDVEVEPA